MISLLLIICSLDPVSASVDTISVSDLTTGLGFNIDADIILNTDDSYGTGTVTVNYDPALVVAVDVRGSQDSIITASNIDNVNGNIKISAWNMNGATGNFPFATVTFKAIDTGVSPLDLSIDTLQDTNYNEIVPVINDGSITIQTGVSIGAFTTSGEIINAAIRINTTENYGTGAIIVDYDPSIVRVTDVQGSDVAAWNADNTNGFVDISTLNVSGTGGNFVFAIITFEPVGNGRSQVGIEIDLLLDTTYNNIPVVTGNGSITVDMGSGTSTDTSDGGGSPGGGGGGSTGEEYENIEHKDVVRKYLNRDDDVSYEFDSEANNIGYIRFIPLKNAGEISATIEVLRDTSALVKNPPSGKVYQNMNIWLGKAGFATSNNIADVKVGFKVERSWIKENGIAISSIRLCRHHNDEWNQLTTQKVGEDEKYIYFESKTLGFSPFAITGEGQALASSTSSTSRLYSVAGSNGVEAASDQIPEQMPEKIFEQNSAEMETSIPGFGLFAGVSVLLMAVQVLCKKKR